MGCANSMYRTSSDATLSTGVQHIVLKPQGALGALRAFLILCLYTGQLIFGSTQARHFRVQIQTTALAIISSILLF